MFEGSSRGNRDPDLRRIAQGLAAQPLQGGVLCLPRCHGLEQHLQLGRPLVTLHAIQLCALLEITDHHQAQRAVLTGPRHAEGGFHENAVQNCSVPARLQFRQSRPDPRHPLRRRRLPPAVKPEHLAQFGIKTEHRHLVGRASF